MEQEKICQDCLATSSEQTVDADSGYFLRCPQCGKVIVRDADASNPLEAISVSFNIYQGTMAMGSIFMGFIFSALLGILLSSEALTRERVWALWWLSISMWTLTISLIFFHATAHRVLRYWGILFPISIFNRLGSGFFSLGILSMFISVGILLLQRGIFLLGILTIILGFGIFLFGISFRRMHKGGKYLINIDKFPKID